MSIFIIHFVRHIKDMLKRFHNILKNMTLQYWQLQYFESLLSSCVHQTLSFFFFFYFSALLNLKAKLPLLLETLDILLYIHI